MTLTTLSPTLALPPTRTVRPESRVWVLNAHVVVIEISPTYLVVSISFPSEMRRGQLRQSFPSHHRPCHGSSTLHRLLTYLCEVCLYACNVYRPFRSLSMCLLFSSTGYDTVVGAYLCCVITPCIQHTSNIYVCLIHRLLKL